MGMPTLPELRHYLEGSWRLAQGDAGGMAYFDFSADGFWRSFWAVIVVAPGYLVLVLDQYARNGEALTFWPGLVAESLSYLLGWAALPVLGIFLTRFYGVADRYVPLIVALNWSTMVQLGVFLVPVALGVILPGDLVAFLLVIATGLVLFYQGFIIKVALDCTISTAATFLAVDVVAVMIINTLLFGAAG